MVFGVDLIPETWIIYFRARGSLWPDCWIISTVVYSLPAKSSTEAKFLKVNIKDYVPPLNVKIVSVNKIASETANENGYMRVLTQAEHANLPEEIAKRPETIAKPQIEQWVAEEQLWPEEQQLGSQQQLPAVQQAKYNRQTFNVKDEVIKGYRGMAKDVIVPSQIADITITMIGEYAFKRKGLNSVILPDSVIRIGYETFAFNKLTSITIHDKIDFVDMGAFYNNPLTSITIGKNVRLGDEAFPNNFSKFYDSQRKRAGTYTWDGKKWSRK